MSVRTKMPARTSLRGRSQQGASFLLALGALLVCAMVAASIVAAASANAQKAAGVQSAQQSYLAASSAARLLADDFDQSAYAATGSVKAPEHTCAYAASHDGASAPEASFAITDATGAAASTALAQLLADGVMAINPADPNARYVRNFTVQADGFDEVEATFTMFGPDGSHDVYDVEIELRSTSESSPVCVIVSSKASTATEVLAQEDTGTCEHYDQWRFLPAYEQQAALDPDWANAQTPAFDAASGNYVVRNNGYGEALATTSVVRDVTRAQTISWDKAYIAKGQVQ